MNVLSPETTTETSGSSVDGNLPVCLIRVAQIALEGTDAESKSAIRYLVRTSEVTRDTTGRIARTENLCELCPVVLHNINKSGQFPKISFINPELCECGEADNAAAVVAGVNTVTQRDIDKAAAKLLQDI